jgi:putative oxidoreductase
MAVECLTRMEEHMDVISKWAQVVGRVALGTIFLVSGLGKLAAWGGTAAYAGSKGVPAILLAIATALELLGAVSVVVGYRARWGALALLIFLVPVTLVFHNFWAAPAQQQQMEMVHFLKNLAIGGGLLIVFGSGAGAFSIDSSRTPARGEPVAVTRAPQ